MPNVLVAHPSLPVRPVKKWLMLAKARSDYGNWGKVMKASGQEAE